MRMEGQLKEVRRCPHCGIANPLLALTWHSKGFVQRKDQGQPSLWAAYACSTCGSVVLTKGAPGIGEANAPIVALFPEPKAAHQDIPELARRYLQQAYDTLHAPDAAAVMAGSSVDAMLKALNYSDGSLYTRIDKAREDGMLTQGMADWAHEVRLGSNRPRHADADRPHVSPEEAAQSVEFAEALANFLFVLTARIDRGIAKAKEATGAK